MRRRMVFPFKSRNLYRGRALLTFLLAAPLFSSLILSNKADALTIYQQEAQNAQEVTLLEPGKPITREIAGGQEHIYKIMLAEDQYGSIIVEQHGIDVVLRLFGIKDDSIMASDSEYRGQGEEKVEMIAETAGSYSVIVESSSKSAPAGSYQIRIAETRAPTSRDRLICEAYKLETSYELALLDGRYDDARRFVEQALAISENVFGTEHPFTATLLDCLAYYYGDKQDYAKAISLYERALAIAEKASGEEHPHTINISRALAFVYLEANEIAKAEHLARRAAEVIEKTLGPEHPVVARCAHTLAQITRDFQKKEQLLQRAIMLVEKTMGLDHHFAAVVLNDLGTLYLDKGDYKQAEPFLLRAQANNEKTGRLESVSQVVTLFNLGRLAREKKDYAKAEENYRKAIAIVEKSFGPDNPRLAVILNNIANIYRARGEYKKSIEAHLRVLRISEKTRGPYHPLTLTSLGNIAKTYAAMGEIAEAIKFQSRADAVIERNIEMNLAIGSERQKLAYLRVAAERTDRTISLNVDLAPLDPEASALAALVLLQRKGRVLDAMSESFASLRQRFRPEEQSLIEQYNSATAELARLVLNGPQSLSFEDHQKKVNELGEKKEELEAEISRRSAEFRSHSQTVTLAAVQAAIPANAALIELAVYRPFDPKAESNSEAYGEPRYIAYVLRQSGEVRWRDLGEAKAIDLSISSLREALGNPLSRDARERSRAVDEKVMRPVRALLGGANQLLISPDGALNLIPFEALVDEQGGYLIRQYAFTYLTSGRDLLRLQVARGVNKQSLVIANPTFGEPDLPLAAKADKRENSASAANLSNIYFAPLTSTAREAETIKSLFPEVSALLQEQATEASLKQVTAPRMLHIATHGFFLTDGHTSPPQGTRAISATARIENPLLRSGLALAGANLHKSDSGEDGILTALEASSLNLWGTKLVVLSACDTGIGEVKNGEGVYGLRRSFVLAGAETLVMSLWPVSDYVTREMMSAYYRGLKQGQGRSESLRQVQLVMLRRKGRDHPFYWASFIQSGEWANLDGRR